MHDVIGIAHINIHQKADYVQRWGREGGGEGGRDVTVGIIRLTVTEEDDQ